MATASTTGAQRRELTAPSAEKIVIDSDIMPPPLDPNAPPPLAWSFRYIGPRAEIDDRNCEQCNAAAMKKCGKRPDQHGNYAAWSSLPKNQGKSAPAPSCPACDAAKQGYCHLHCGLDRALDEHPNRIAIDTAHLPTWIAAKAAILAYVSTLPKDVTTIDVHAHAQQDQPTFPFAALSISIVARK
jgi:hypothetical protein